MPRKLVHTKDIIGKKYGRLTIIEDLGKTDYCRRVMAKCDCGVIKKYPLNGLRMGGTTSCGCFRLECISKRMKKHGLSKHPLFSIWSGIIQRCYSKRDPQYRIYGGRGVRVAKEWKNNFQLFYDWCMANGWEKGLEIDKDKMGNGLLYGPNTCSVLTSEENSHYKSTNFNVKFNGETKCLKVWCIELGLNYKITHQRLNRDGWNIEDALNPSYNNTGQVLKGENSPNSKFTNKQVIEIFNSTEKLKTIAERYNTKISTISNIKTGHGWGHITGKIYNPKKR